MAGITEKDLTTAPDPKLPVWNLFNPQLSSSYSGLGSRLKHKRERFLKGHPRGKQRLFRYKVSGAGVIGLAVIGLQ